MSYPEPIYRGDRGLNNATFRPSDHTPDLTYPSGGTAHYLATGRSTNGRFGLYRWDMAAAPSGPKPHFHRTISESFYVLAGIVRLYNGADWIEARPGDFLLVPEGGVHAFRNESSEPASMLILFVPGAPREDYFETLARVAEGLVLTDEEKTEFFLRHDTHWL
jgi:quercetin dioxygenase-like cupin family protein